MIYDARHLGKDSSSTQPLKITLSGPIMQSIFCDEEKQLMMLNFIEEVSGKKLVLNIKEDSIEFTEEVL